MDLQLGGSVKVAGKVVGSKFKGTGEWIEDVGAGVQSTSKIALENVGQFVDGTVQTPEITLHFSNLT